MSHYSNAKGSAVPSLVAKVKRAYDQETLRTVLEMHESRFEAAYGMERVNVDQSAPADFYLFLDRGASVLAVAHLDTVARHSQRRARFVRSEAGSVVFSRALDDRLGAYTILELLPALGINVDILLTTGEESGSSTAAYFETEKEYNWVIEFDRGGTDVVMYQYDDYATQNLVRAAGATCGRGSYSDIAYLDHLGLKCFNWGIGYGGNYHGPRAHAFLADTFTMVSQFIRFWDANSTTVLPHTPRPVYKTPAVSTTYDEWIAKRDGNTSNSGQYRNRKKRDWWQDNEHSGAIVLYDKDKGYTPPVKSVHRMTEAEWDAYCAEEDSKGKSLVVAPNSDRTISDEEIKSLLGNPGMTTEEMNSRIAQFGDGDGDWS